MKNALIRLIFWFLVGALFAICLLKLIKSRSQQTTIPKSNLTILNRA